MSVSPPSLQCDLHALWTMKRGTRPVPLRSAFDVIELRPWLGFLCLVDIETHGYDFRYRLFGTRIANLIGRELTGLRLSQIDACLREGWEPGYMTVSRSGEPQTFFPLVQEAWRTIEMTELVLPLSRDGHRTDMLLTCCCPR